MEVPSQTIRSIEPEQDAQTNIFVPVSTTFNLNQSINQFYFKNKQTNRCMYNK